MPSKVHVTVASQAYLSGFHDDVNFAVRANTEEANFRYPLARIAIACSFDNDVQSE
jgi:hypothetical protein